MADSKISALTALGATPASGDLFVVVDVSDTTMAASGTNKKVTFSEVTSGLLTSSTGLLATGATTGATSQAQTFTNGAIFNTAPSTTNSFLIGGRYNPTDTSGTHTNGNFQTVATPTGSTTASYRALSFDVGSASGNVNNFTATFGIVAVVGTINHRGSGTLTGTCTYYVTNPSASGGGTITTVYGIYMDSLTRGSTNYAIYTNGGLVRLGDRLIAAASTTSAASATITQGSAPTAPAAGDVWNDGALSFYNADSTTNAVVNHLRLRRDSTGTAAAGFGLGIIAELESSTTSAQSAGRLTWAWSTATHASRAAIGKLTAFYTSTEREAITWVADSTGVAVGINTSSPQALLHVASAATGGTSVIFQNSDTGGKSYVMLSTGSGNTGGAGNLQIVENTSGNRLHFDGPNNRLGLNVTSPAGLIHGYDGSGGFLFVNRTGVDSTLVTVIPDGTGDVTERLHMFGWVSNSSGGFVSQVNEVYLDVSSSTTKTDGSNTLTIAVTAAGAFTLQTTLGTATWKVLLWVFWR